MHISDLTALYGRIISKVLRKETISSGAEGYYFALAHDIYWWEVLDHLAVALKARNLVTDAKTQIWPNDEAAADALGVPVQFVQTLWNSGWVLHVGRTPEEVHLTMCLGMILSPIMKSDSAGNRHGTKNDSCRT